MMSREKNRILKLHKKELISEQEKCTCVVNG
jgi:hypothetical protein